VVNILTDTKPGKTVDRERAALVLTEHLTQLRVGSVSVVLLDDLPRATMLSAEQAQAAARRIIVRPLYLRFEDLNFTVPRTIIGSWVTNEYEGNELLAGFNIKMISQYVTRIADQINIAAEPAEVMTQDGLITGFTPPKYGRAVKEDETVELIVDALQRRADNKRVGDLIAVPVRQSTPPSITLGDGSGVTELIGAATTPFTGSPRNRISNIKNGVRFLSGVTVRPDEEFSTLERLGTIDNTTGYLPEMVIKGDRTVPEYGGGLCQVSTTMFRAALDAGLPITGRRNHSFRVSYYEKDGDGNYIGPGLDATIYEPNLDLKFLNDTGNPILIIGYVHGDRITFELYGTKDGRTSSIDGPYTLTEVPAGDPVYIDTDELAKGEVEQVEWPHAGGSAVATYTILYRDGTEDVQEFSSWYRRWPAKYLVGTRE
jgi:vancomycin resistance protein YoaR